MRQQFVPCKTRGQAQKACPWVAVIARVEGGFRCFESFNDYQIWRKQK